MKYLAGALGVIVLAVASALGGGVIALQLDDEDAVTPAVVTQTQPRTTSEVTQSLSDVSELYAAVRPSVVRIEGSGGLGSGVVIDSQGHILTNNHVVEDLTNISVRFADGSVYEATVVGTDPGNDLAVIEVDAPADLLRPATLGDSESVKVGELVIAIGNPFDIEGTLTQGVVSGVGRTLTGNTGRPLRKLIQSDAAINPGNSGGGLFNASGELVGITTAIENPSGDRVFVGIGYAVPIDTAKQYLPQMLAGTTVQHPKLGVSLQDVSPALAAELGLSVESGVLVGSVEPGSGADAAGLRGGSGRTTVGDVIVKIDSVEVKVFSDVANYLDTKQVGDTVNLTVVRDGDELTVPVTLEAWVG